MIVLAEDEDSGAKIYKWDKHDNNPVFEITINKYSYSHSVRNIESPEHYDWYCGVVGGHYKELHERSVAEGKKIVRDLFNEALAI